MALRDMTTFNRKKYQRVVNKMVYSFNKSVKNDWLWNGRFVMRQCAFYCRPYEDHSGMDCTFILELKDMKTNRVETKVFDQYDIERGLWFWANECITETWEVWYEDPNPNVQAHLEGRLPNA